MQNTQQNSLARVTKDQKKFQEKNGRIYSNSSNLIAYLQVTNNLKKNMDVHMTILVYNFELFIHIRINIHLLKFQV